MGVTIEMYFLLFFASSILGWLGEVTCKLIQFHRFINRGFLIGPYCPIYGCGAVVVALLLTRYQQDPVVVFLMAIILCGTLEYLTSYVMEKLFHARWWDYSNRRFNLNGRICANTLLPFGALGLVMVYFIKPLFFGWFALIPENTLTVLTVCAAAVMLTDAIISSCVLGKVRKTANLTDGDNTEAITAKVRDALANSHLAHRLLHAFPYARIGSNDLFRQLRAREKALRHEIDQKREAWRSELARREQSARARHAKQDHENGDRA